MKKRQFFCYPTVHSNAMYIHAEVITKQIKLQ
jgi:hypothetical protein